MMTSCFVPRLHRESDQHSSSVEKTRKDFTRCFEITAFAFWKDFHHLRERKHKISDSLYSNQLVSDAGGLDA